MQQSHHRTGHTALDRKSPRYVWVYDFAALDNALVINNLVHLGMHGVFVGIDPKKLGAQDSPYRAKVQDFLGRAHRCGLQIHLMTLQCPQFCLPEKHERAYSHVAHLLECDGLEGVHIDCEPHALKEFKTGSWQTREALMNGFLELVERLAGLTQSRQVPLSLAVSWRYHEWATSGQMPSGHVNRLAQHADFLVIMAYHVNQVANRLEEQVRATPSIIGLHAEEEQLPGQLNQLESRFGRWPNYGGISFFDYQRLLRRCQM